MSIAEGCLVEYSLSLSVGYSCDNVAAAVHMNFLFDPIADPLTKNQEGLIGQETSVTVASRPAVTTVSF